MPDHIAHQQPLFLQNGERRMRNHEVVFPIVTGTVAFYLGKKATEYASHRWTLYVRGANDEDITHVVKSVRVWQANC